MQVRSRNATRGRFAFVIARSLVIDGEAEMPDNDSVVGPETRIVGEIRGDEDLVVCGRVEGKIQLGQTLTVAEGAIVEADLDVRALVVSGVLVGAIRASHSVRLTEKARVIGDVTSPSFIVEAGAAYRGHVDMGAEEPPVRSIDRRTPAVRTGEWQQARWPTALSGALEHAGIASLLTLLEMERRTGVLELRSRLGLSQLVLRDGFVVSALVDGSPVPTCDVVSQYLGWNGGRFVFRVGDLGAADEVGVPTTLLLLEAARRIDEAGPPSTPASPVPIAAEPPTARWPASRPPPALAGTLEHVGIATLLTLLEMERGVGMLELRSRRHVAQLTVRERYVMSAMVDGSPLPICDAVCQLLQWNRGRFVFRRDAVDIADELAMPTTALLLEAGRRADANAAA
jgi:cytoskeletal protein CcmA (bactofilin family)